jgi:hypothetical protein
VTYARGGSGASGSVRGTSGGSTNTGGGGAGSQSGGGGGSAGNSGIVVVRYPSNFSDFLAVTGSPTLTNANGFKVYVFTSSGSITI